MVRTSAGSRLERESSSSSSLLRPFRFFPPLFFIPPSPLFFLLSLFLSILLFFFALRVLLVNRQLHRDCPGNPSKLGMEVPKRMANRKTPQLGHEWPLSVDVAPPTGDGCCECLSVTRATLCHARSRMALWLGGLGRGVGGEWALSLRRYDVAPECGVSVL